MTLESRQSLNQSAWIALNEQHHILDQVAQRKIATLTADQIRLFREPRLLTKFEEKSGLPPFLRDNDLAILPQSRNRFLIGHFKVFHELPNFARESTTLISGSDLVSLRLRPNSETTSILVALDTGMFENFLGESPARIGVMGRMGSGDFSFTIDGYDSEISVTGSQVEIDAGVETPASLALIEAKGNEVESFLVRQLYYPFRTWTEKVGRKLKVRPIFLTVSNDRFRFIEYRFADEFSYSSIEMIQHRTFRLSDSIIPETSVQKFISMPQSPIAIDVPYPQANSIDRIVSLLISISESDGLIHKEDVASQQVFHERQADYYLNAARYLGLIQPATSGGQVFELTLDGLAIAEAGTFRRTNLLVERLLRDPVVRAVFDALRNHSTSRELQALAIAAAVEKMHELVNSGYIINVGAESTFLRRAETMATWSRWVMEHVSFQV